MSETRQQTLKVDGDQPIEHVVIGLRDQPRCLRAGVVHGAIEPAVRLHRHRDELLYRGVVGDVGLDEGHLPARGPYRRGRGGAGVDVDIATHNLGAIRGERFGQHLPASFGHSGDHHHLVRERCHEGLPPRCRPGAPTLPQQGGDVADGLSVEDAARRPRAGVTAYLLTRVWPLAGKTALCGARPARSAACWSPCSVTVAPK